MENQLTNFTIDNITNNRNDIINQFGVIEKAIVHSHQRKTKSGKLVQVKEYEDKRQKKYLNEKTDFNKFKDKEGNIDCHNKNLTSLKGAPKVTEGVFDCDSNNLTSLKGSPKVIKDYFSCSFNKLTSLEGSPEIVGGDFNCSNNKITSLKGAPKVKGSFGCSENRLTSLEGAPKIVKGDFDCANNELTSLKGAPEVVEGNFICFGNKVKFTAEDVKKVCKVSGKIYFRPKFPY